MKMLMVVMLVMLVCLPVWGQTGKAVLMSEADQTSARLAWEKYQKAKEEWGELKVSMERKYVPKVKQAAGGTVICSNSYGGVMSDCKSSGDETYVEVPDPDWGMGVEFNEDFSVVMPKPQPQPAPCSPSFYVNSSGVGR